ncbi:hypothetical protein CGRA01v4_11801 [Colletotrichum graminicola]|nr:hypothetical protein CGRA01v4_11801 [Colletotrichum graminicola]
MNPGEGGNLYLPLPLPIRASGREAVVSFFFLFSIGKESLRVNGNHLLCRRPLLTNGSQASRDPGSRGVKELRGAWLFFSPLCIRTDSSVLSPFSVVCRLDTRLVLVSVCVAGDHPVPSQAPTMLSTSGAILGSVA